MTYTLIIIHNHDNVKEDTKKNIAKEWRTLVKQELIRLFKNNHFQNDPGSPSADQEIDRGIF